MNGEKKDNGEERRKRKAGEEKNRENIVSGGGPKTDYKPVSELSMVTLPVRGEGQPII